MALERIAVERRDTLSTEIARRLLEYLLAGDVQLGDRLPSERQLAADLGVGRSIVREALKSLTLLGIVEVRQGDGTFLKSAESDLLPQAIEWGLLLGAKRTQDLVEARQHLEVVVAGLAAERRSDDDLRHLRAYLDDMRIARDTESFVAADVAFHLVIARAAGNETLNQIMSSIRSLLQVWISRVIGAATDYEPMLRDHVVIFDALERRSPDGARHAMEAHMVHAARRLQVTLPPMGESDHMPVEGAARPAGGRAPRA